MPDMQIKQTFSIANAEVLSVLKREGNFDITPLNEQVNLADTSQFTKIKMSPSEVSHVGALMSQMPSAFTSGAMSNCELPAKLSLECIKCQFKGVKEILSER